MKPEEFNKAVEKGELASLYLLFGDEPYLVERAVKKLLDRAVDPGFRDFNLDVFYGNECKGEEVFSAAQTLPMFADRRVVLVKKGGDLSAHAMEVLLPYLQDPSPGTCLILQAEKVDGRKKFYAELKKRGEAVEFKRPYENQLGPYVRDEVRAAGKKIEPAAAELLGYLVGNNLQELVSQIEKLCIYCGKKETVAVADVKAIVSDTKVESVFEFTDALGSKDLPRALKMLTALLQDGEVPLRMLGAVARHFRQLWQVRELLDKKVPQSELAKASGINPYFLNKVTAQARNYTVVELQRIFERMLELDLAFKSGGLEEPLLERFVMDACRRQP
ncbi:DNA polymerase III subunit delta [Geomonas subterranea]|uniref:DNA polymerase III subunit delta n=1 Tax=Geomonas subterranea TaxID=2847989 RepID=A0ABX8LF36_9BACT|nr:DNA polymerase III subunit delta [Geomonas subterranea]QXE89260.1 DNA polymerase III subunit delta [Geomonas subterranea]QXM11694.1 DNA polymerase III subunit delta [Geomonas subterranea]